MAGRPGRILRGLLAYLVAPFPAAIFQSLIVALQSKAGGAAIYAHPLSLFVAVCLFFFAFGLVLAVPLVLAFRRLWPGRRAYVRAGALAGLLVPVVAMFTVTVENATMSAFAALYILIFFGLGGYAAGALYWRI